MITITRESAFADYLRSYVVLLDDRPVGKIRNGQSLQIETTPGHHTLSLKIDWFGGNAVEFEDEGQALTFRCGPNLDGINLLLGPVYTLAAPRSMLWLAEGTAARPSRPLRRWGMLTGIIAFPAMVSLCFGVLTLVEEIGRTSGLCYEFLTVFQLKDYSLDAQVSLLTNPPARIQLLSIWLFASAFVAVACALGAVKRFSLRRLLVLMLITGLLGALPHVVLEKHDPAALFAVKFDKPLEEKRIAAVTVALQPHAAAATWPTGMVEQVGIAPEDGILRVTRLDQPKIPRDYFRDELTADFAFLVEFRPGSTRAQRRALREFYDTYLQTLLMEAADEEGSCDRIYVQRSDLPWSRSWQDTYLQGLLALPAERWPLEREHRISGSSSQHSSNGNLAFSSDGGEIWVFPKGVGRKVDVASGRVSAEVPGYQGCAVSSRDGSMVATTTNGETAILWDGKTGACLPRELKHPAAAIIVMAFSPDGRFLATSCDRDKLLRLWQVESGQVVLKRNYEPAVNQIAWSPDAQQLVLSQWNGSVRLLNTATGTEVSLDWKHFRPGWPITFAPDGRQFAAAFVYRLGPRLDSVRIWDAKTFAYVGVLRCAGLIDRLAYSPDGRLLAVAVFERSATATVRIFDLQTFRMVAAVAHLSRIDALTFSPDGKLLATQHFDGYVRLWRRPETAP